MGSEEPLGKSAVGKKATIKEGAATKKALAKTETTNKRGGVKRTSTDGNNPKQSGRTSKRVKKSEPNTATLSVSHRTTRSRSRPRSVASRSKAKKKSKTKSQCVAVNIVPADKNCIVPQDFGLKRDSLSGQHFTYGIAHYDA